MSCYKLQTKNQGTRVDVGYDVLLDTYFLQIRVRNEHGKSSLKTWEGHGIGGSAGNSIIHDPYALWGKIDEHALVPVDLMTRLIEDRNPTPELIEIDPVIYVGTMDKEVWRHRPGSDPEMGVQIDLAAPKHLSRERQIALAVLRDVLGNEVRAKTLVREVAVLLQNTVLRRTWLVNENDLMQAIRNAEMARGLTWIASANCYSGHGKPCEPEAQLLRNSRDASGWKMVPPIELVGAPPRPKFSSGPVHARA